MKFLINRLILIIGVFLYALALHVLYIYVISPQFSYIGYIYNSASIIILIVSIFLAILPSFWIPISLGRPSQVVYWFLYLVVYIPINIFPYYTLKIVPSKIVLFNLTIFMALGIIGLFYKLPLVRIPKLSFSKYPMWIFVIFISISTYGLMFYVFGSKVNVVSLLDVYSLRSEYVDAVSKNGRIMSYLIGWQANVINPFIMGYGILCRKYIVALSGVIGQLLIFSITGYKSVLFSWILIVGLLFLISKRKRYGIYFTWLALGLVAISYATDILLKTNIVTSLVVRRIVVTPGLLTGYYYDYFLSNPKVFLGHSIFKAITTYPYDTAVPNIISKLYLGMPEGSANVNLWGDAYANFGFAGIIVYSVLLGTVLWFYDSITANVDYKLAGLMLGMPALSLSNSALLTCLLTHGIGFTLLLAYLIPRRKKDYE